MITTLASGLKVKTIGDPHLGRNFSVGCSPSRRGEREESQFLQLALELNEPQCNVNVMMGDIFDKFSVDSSIVMRTYELYANAAVKNPHVDYILLRGNHDVSRDSNRSSSFDILVEMIKGFRNIRVVEDSMVYVSRDQASLLLLCGYNPFYTTTEILDGMAIPDMEFFDAAFGHWDTESFGGDDHNLLPYTYLASLTDTIFTGHIHTPERFYIHAESGKRISRELTAKYEHAEVIVTGSMQPYTHGEDPHELLYTTKTLDEYNEAILKNPMAYHDMCLRLKLQPDEELPDNIDALQFTYQRVNEDNPDGKLEVKMGDFDFEDLFRKTMEHHGVDEPYTDQMWETYKEMASHDS